MLEPIEEEEEARVAVRLGRSGTIRRQRRPRRRLTKFGDKSRRSRCVGQKPATGAVSDEHSNNSSSSSSNNNNSGDNKPFGSQVSAQPVYRREVRARLDQQELYFGHIRAPYGDREQPTVVTAAAAAATSSPRNRSPLEPLWSQASGEQSRIKWAKVYAMKTDESEWRHSCLLKLVLASLRFLFPVLGSFKGYSLAGDLANDLVAGFTIAVLHIPQGMAYGLLAGVEPIHGLYVSFVPVLVMALMSRSRHVSYGTFAVISMLLANASDNVKQALRRQLGPGAHQLLLNQPSPTQNGSHQPLEGLVLVDNHQRPESLLEQQLLVGTAETQNTIITNDDDLAMPTNIEILTCLCLVVGLIQAAMALVRLGALSLMFSDQLVSSFTCASAIHVVSSQLAGLFDLQLAPVPEGLFRVCRLWWHFAERMLEGAFNPHTAALSLLSILFLVSVKELLEPRLRRRLNPNPNPNSSLKLSCLPSELVLMAALILASWYWRFNHHYGIHTIGHVPSSLPSPKAPRLELAPLLLQDALTVALVSFAMNLSLAQVYAKRFRYKMNPNQELFALGTSNIIGSFFSCFPCASSLSRSAVQSNLNVRSPISSLFSCAMVVAIICYFAHILYDLPRSTLSCIIVVALKGILVQCRDLRDTWHLSKLDALVWLTTFVSVIAFGVTYGLILGILASLLIVFFRLFTPNFSILGRLPGTEIYVDLNCFIDCNEIEQVRIFRFNSALCYLNRTMFKSSIEKCVPSVAQSNQNKLLKSFCCASSRKHLSAADLAIKFLIIDCSALAYCDHAGASTLAEIIEEFGEKKVTVYLAACPLALVDMLEKMHNPKVIEHHMFPTITDAISQAKYLTRMNRVGSEVDFMTDTCLQSISLTCQPRRHSPLLD